MNEKLPLHIILETAKKLNEIEEKISDIYNSVNLVLEQAITNAKNTSNLRDDTINQFLLIYEEIDKLKNIRK